MNTDVELVIEARNGNESAKEELIDRCRKVTSYHIQKYRSMYYGRLNHFDIEDLTSECHIAVLEAIKQFNVEVPHKFESYAKLAIRNRIVNFLDRKLSKHNIKIDPDYDMNTIAAPNSESRESKLDKLNITNDRDKKMIQLFLEGETMQEIGRQFGLTKGRIHQIFKKYSKGGK